MRAERRLIVVVLLAAMLAGCAAPMTLAQLELPDGYYATAPEAAPLQPATLEHCWSWLDDSLMGELAEAADEDAAVRAELAERYSLMRARQAQVENARGYLAAQQDNLEIARFREQAGLVTARDALQAETDRARAATAIPTLEAQIAGEASRVAVLAGQAPAALRDRLVLPGPIPTEPAEVALGLPSDLTTRRADLIEAEKKLRRTSAAVSPKAAAAYRAAVLKAVAEVEDARAAFDGSVARAIALAAASEKAADLARLTRAQYRDGQADYAALSNAEDGLWVSRDTLAEARAERAGAAIKLCVALGGGRPAPVLKAKS